MLLLILVIDEFRFDEATKVRYWRQQKQKFAARKIYNEINIYIYY